MRGGLYGFPLKTPKNTVQRGRMKGKATRGNVVTYGEFGLQAQEPCWITSNQIEAARIAMTRYTKRGGQVWIKIFPDKPVTAKPAETRMGSGKGSPEYWVAVVKPGRVMFEIAGVSEETAREALRQKWNAYKELPTEEKQRFEQAAKTPAAKPAIPKIGAPPIKPLTAPPPPRGSRGCGLRGARLSAAMKSR